MRKNNIPFFQSGMVGFFLSLILLVSVLTAAAETSDVTLVVDQSKKSAPISKYIYGQFIEHLGRCIYGGIWSEMLEDRKFFDSVGAKESPWFAVYDCDIQMVTKDPFVGTHTPECRCETERWIGVAQKGLAFQKGRKYKGYAWVRPSRGIQRVDVHFHYMLDGKDQSKVFTWKPEFDRYTKVEFELESPVTFNDVKIEVAAKGIGTFQVGTVSVMPSDNIHGMRADTLKLLKELDSPVYRWPGGNFVSGYDWKDGIGDRDHRPPRKNPAWKGIEHNDFGFDEFMVFCRYLQTEPYIAVNTGSGQVTGAVDELQYANGSPETPMGKLRVKNGHAEPYGVRWWCVGNEMYGNWQIGHMSVDDYIKKHNLFAEKFRETDPNVRLVGVGAVGKWDEAFIPGAFGHMEYLSEHIYVRNKPDTVEHCRLVANAVRRVTNAHRDYEKRWPNLYAQKKLPVVMDEWNYWYGPEIFGQIGTRYFVKDGAGIAMGLHEFYRASDLYIMANYAQTVNVIGAIKTSKTSAQMETTGLVLTLYRKWFGSIPVECKVAGEKESPLDVSAALTADGRTLTLSIVNPSQKNISVQLDAAKLKTAESGKLYVIADPENNPLAHNDPDVPQRIKIVEKDFQVGNYIAGPLSVNLIRLPVK